MTTPVHPEGPGYSREARAHTRSDQPHKAPLEDEAVVEQLLGTLARYDGHFGPRDARNYATSVLDMARGHRGITPASLVTILELCPNGRWHFASDCPDDCAATETGG